MKRKSIFLYIFIPHALALLLTLIAAGGWALHGARHEHYTQTRDNLRRAALMMADSINRLPDPSDTATVDALCKSKGTSAGYRFTVVLNSGRVIGDTDENPQIMDNHYRRPEIRQLHGEPLDAVGWADRRSGTVQMTMMYVAVVWHQGGERLGFVRAARPMGDIDLALIRQRVRVLYAGLWMSVIVIIGSAVIAGRLSAPLIRMRESVETYAAGRADLRLPASAVREIHALSEAMNAMSQRLSDRFETIVRQRDEQKALLSCMSEAILAMDAQGRIISMNPAAINVFQPTSEPVIGRQIQEVVRNADIQRLSRTIMETNGTLNEEITIPNGERILQINGTAMTDSHGHRIGCVLVMTDVTRLRKLETMRRDFVANVSHELKTPVTSISGFSETLLDGAAEDPESRTRFLKIIRHQARRLNAILEDLMTLSRLEHDAQNSDIPVRPTPIRPILENAVKTWQPEAAPKNMRLTINCDAAWEASVNAPLIEQAMINIIGNAVKYGPAKTGITVSAERDANEIRLSVKDEGPGIARHHLPRLFERFYRVDKGRSRDIGGTGLGLAIVKSIAVAHGGRVSVDSTPGKGSVFTIHLASSRRDTVVSK